MTTTATAIQAPLLRSLAMATNQQCVNVLKKNAVHISTKSPAFGITTPSSPTSGGSRFAIAASRSTKDEATSKSDHQDDLSFLLKLGAGSFAGAAAIKYGSIVLPEITRPNIIQALVMISTPVIVAVVILIRESGGER